MKNLQLIAALIMIIVGQSLFGQTISNVDFDQIEKEVKNSSSNYYYPKLLSRFLQFDTTLTDTDYKFIYYGNVFYEHYAPYGTNKEDAFMKIYAKKKYKKAIPLGQKVLNENPVNSKILFKMLVCYNVLGDKITAKKYARLYFSLLNAIYDSGDGKSFEAAYVVIKVPDEYEILVDLELSANSQALSGDTDILTINTKGQTNKEKLIEKLYFNVSKPLDYLSQEFRKSQESKKK